MTEKQQQLTFEKGITNVPSDALCPDNTLEECVGMFYENGEHRVVQRPVEEMADAPKLLYVHHPSNGIENYIVVDGYDIKWGTKEDGEYIPSQSGGSDIVLLTVTDPSSINIESVGNTLVLSSSDGLCYVLWSEDTYKLLGDNVPDIRVKFMLDDFKDDFDESAGETEYANKCIWLTELLDGYTIYQPNPTIVGSRFKDQFYEDAKSGLIGLVASRINTVKENKRFAFPFWVRYAIRLYDGNYINISNPILLLPSVLNNWHIYTCDDNGDEKQMDGNVDGGWPQTNYRPISAVMKYSLILPNGFNKEDWRDIISGVDVFVSNEVKNFDMEGTWTTQSYNSPTFDGGVIINDYCNPVHNVVEAPRRGSVPSVTGDDVLAHRVFFKPSLLSQEEVIDGLVKNSVFYKIFDLDLDDFPNDNNYYSSADKIGRNVLKNLTTQEQLPYDDYFSRTDMVASALKAFNSRLHIANIQRGFFDGFNNFSFTEYSGNLPGYGGEDLDFFVYIKSESGERIVRASASGTKEIPNVWFYYPDPRAYKVDIIKRTNGDVKLLFSLPLKQHPYLNGAFYFKVLPDGRYNLPAGIQVTLPTENNDNESLGDHIFVSDVNNPFLFTSKGDIRVGMGDIIGIATQTMSLGEMEHGIHPLTVFSEKGISLLKLADDGTYTRSDEISREVCNNAKSITETDGPVFFSSEKGLMVVLGNQVNCVSEQLSGKSDDPFQKYLRTAFLAYDYRDSLLWIFDGATHDNNVVGSRYCYLYSIKTGTFSRYDFGNNNIVSNVVSTYPDYLLQIGSNIYSLLHRANINDDNDDYSATFTTRPMKLENALALKSIMQIKHIKDMDGALTINISASNNLKDWCELSSLRGTPWKYYKFQYNFSNMKATDRFAGSVLITQERRTDKLR